MSTFFLNKNNAHRIVAPTIPWQDCVAKSASDERPGISILDHSRCTALMASALIKVWGLSNELSGIAAIAAVHDVGKISPGFQAKLGAGFESPGAETNHALIGESAVYAYLGATTKTPVTAAIVGAHHGARSAMVPFDDSIGTMGGPNWAAERRAFIQTMIGEFGSLPKEIPQSLIPIATGLVVLADWLASGFTNTEPRVVLNQLGLDLKPLPWTGFEVSFRFEPNQLQKQALEAPLDPSGLYLIDAPMGTGKTEAAMALAGRFIGAGICRGLYFALPTMATANAMLTRTQEFLITLGIPGARIIHGQSWLHPTGGGELAPGGGWFVPTKRGLVFPYAVGTIDQALLSCMRVKHHQLRQAGLVRRVVVVDEVHSYDSYTGTLVSEMIKTLRGIGCPVVVMSATLAESQKREFKGVGGFFIKGDSSKSGQTIQLSLAALSPEALAIAAVEAARRGAVVAVVANTVSRSQSYFRAIKALSADIPVGLIHSRLFAAERSKRENHWLALLGKKAKLRDGCILIGTQVLEQSLDVDFDLLFSDLAPVDLLLQRLGRLWRHQRENRAVATPRSVLITQDLSEATSAESLISLIGRNSAAIYPPHLLWWTHQVLTGKKMLKLPEEISRLIEAVYDPDDPGPSFIQALSKQVETEYKEAQKLALAAGADSVSLPVADDDYAKTRWGSMETVPAVIANAIDGELISLITGQQAKIDSKPSRTDAARVAAKLALATVPAPRHHLPKNLKKPAWLERYLYGGIMLTRDESGCLYIEGHATSLFYDHQLGLFYQRD